MPRLEPVPLERRRELTAAACTLDGRPAQIAGALNPHATVAQYPTGLAVSFSWPTVVHVVEHGAGAFRS